MSTASPYPETVANDTNLPDVVQYVDTYDAEHMNMVRAFIRDMTAEIGTNPSGNKSTLAERLAVSLDNDGKLVWPDQVVTVAQNGGHFPTIQSAIDSITDASVNKPYTVMVYPGLYTESVTLKDYVNLVGTDRNNCILLYSAFNGVGLTVPSDSHCKVSNMSLETTEPFSKTIDSYAASLEINNCHINGESYCLYSNRGTLNVYNSVFSGNMSAIYCTEDNANIYVYNTIFNMVLQIMVLQGVGEFGLYNCHGTGNMIQVDRGAFEMHNCSFKTSSFTLTTIEATVKLCNSVLQAGGDNSAVKVMNPSGSLTATHCKLLKSGNTLNALYAHQPNTEVRVAHCTMNAGWHSNMVNLIDTPYNVMDSDLI